MSILAIDPGPEQSAWVLWNDGKLETFGQELNSFVRTTLCTHIGGPTLVVEAIEGYGKAVGVEVFETLVWIGRFLECWERGHPSDSAVRLSRRRIKLTLCGSSCANDKDIRAELLRRYGGKEAALGTKDRPGPLRGVSKDVWAALSVAVAYHDIQEEARRSERRIMETARIFASQ